MLCLGTVACGSGHTAKPDAPPDAPPPPTLTVYLSFDGETIEPAMTGADDAATNHSSIVSSETVVPPYLMGQTSRDTTIASIITETKARFSPFNAAIVTDRPTSSDYFMIVFTGQPSVVFGPGQGSGTSVVTNFPCSNTTPLPPTPSSIAFMFQSGPTTDAYNPVERGNLAIPAVALAQNIQPTTQTGDCLCFSAAGCGLPSSTCTIGGPGTPVDTAHACAGSPATEDEMSLLVAAFGARP
jgi:hypothetical protein